MFTMNASNATQAEGISHHATLFRKRCRFQNTVLVKEIPTHRTYSASERHMSWYTNEELALFNRNKYPNKKTKRSKDCHDVSPKKQPHSGRRPTSPDHDSTLKSLLPSSSLPLFDPSPKTAMRDVDVAHSNQLQKICIRPNAMQQQCERNNSNRSKSDGKSRCKKRNTQDMIGRIILRHCQIRRWIHEQRCSTSDSESHNNGLLPSIRFQSEQ